jgi:isoleucyl-tRNA synthetase
VFGSVAELTEASGETINDLHKDQMDLVKVPCTCGATMNRIPDVLDCWFESGSMPYAQQHYPFENKAKFEANFPAQFIAEGVDQTRAWFYYLHIISNGLQDTNAFKNAIVNGIVLAEDGKKMSKKLKNYPDPNLVLDFYGADALRAYLLASPVMQAENMSFTEKGVEESLRKNVMTLWNVYKFYETYIQTEASETSVPLSDNVLDKWISARLDQLTEELTTAFDNYDLPRTVRPITLFIDDFSTWYLRRSRDRFKSSDRQQVLSAMKDALLRLSVLMAPAMPFLSETLWQRLSGHNFQSELDSVHLQTWPQLRLADESVLKEMAFVRKIVELGLAKRDEAKVKIRQPLNQLTVMNAQVTDAYLDLIKDELNVLTVLCQEGTGELSVTLDLELTEALVQGGAKRELVRAVNALRKEAGLSIQDQVTIHCLEADQWLQELIADCGQLLCDDTLSVAWLLTEPAKEPLISKQVDINGHQLTLTIVK